MIELALVWLAIIVSFLLGVAYNSGAYDRGHKDGWSEGFNDAIMDDDPRERPTRLRPRA